MIVTYFDKKNGIVTLTCKFIVPYSNTELCCITYKADINKIEKKILLLSDIVSIRWCK